MQPAEIDFLEVERERAFSVQLNIDGYDFTGSDLAMNVYLTPTSDPVLTLSDTDIFREEGDTDTVISLTRTAEQMQIPARQYLYDLTDKAQSKTIIKGLFQVI